MIPLNFFIWGQTSYYRKLVLWRIIVTLPPPPRRGEQITGFLRTFSPLPFLTKQFCCQTGKFPASKPQGHKTHLMSHLQSSKKAVKLMFKIYLSLDSNSFKCYPLALLFMQVHPPRRQTLFRWDRPPQKTTSFVRSSLLFPIHHREKGLFCYSPFLWQLEKEKKSRGIVNKHREENNPQASQITAFQSTLFWMKPMKQGF